MTDQNSKFSSFKKITCNCCNQPLGKFWFVKQNQEGIFPIIYCTFCKCSFVWPRPSSIEIMSYYQNISYNKTVGNFIENDLRYYPSSTQDSERIIGRCRLLSQGINFLDIGAGNGFFSKKAMQNGFRVNACEPNPNSRKVFLQMNGFNPDIEAFDRDYALNHKNKFDVVLLSQVLEHVPDINQFVQNIRIVLRKNGVAAIAVPHFGSALSRIQGKKDMFISPPEHLNFFSLKGLIALFHRNDFKTEYIETVTKVNKGKIENLIRNQMLSSMAWRTLYTILKIFELFQMGMVLNAYFRKK